MMDLSKHLQKQKKKSSRARKQYGEYLSGNSTAETKQEW